MTSKAYGLATLAVVSTGGAIAEFVASHSSFFSGVLCGGIFSIVAYSVRKSNKGKNGEN